jgi:1-acyl-sn-glycerol-3-phosphate acyltransferase
MEQSGSIPIDRADPAPSSIKSAVDALRQGELILIFPSGTRSQDAITFKRGAATIALHAQVPIIPAFYQGPAQMQIAHLMGRPRIQIAFGPVIPTAGLPVGKATTLALTQRLQTAIEDLRPAVTVEASAA